MSRLSTRISKVHNIDVIVAQEETARKARAKAEAQRRVDLAKGLGDGVMKGRSFGIAGFMAIGFPKLLPESEEYQGVVRALGDVKSISPGKCIAVGESWTGVVGIKAEAPNKGLVLSVKPEASGGYYVEADVLCSRALYEHNPAETGTMHGSEQEPYPVTFIDTLISDSVRPVREMELDGIAIMDGNDHDAVGRGYVHLQRYTQRLMAESVTA